MQTRILNQIGLTDSEINVYFALLELETSTVGKIIDKSKVPDSKIYALLDRLKEKGLVSFVIKNNVKHFQASDPKRLLSLLNEKEREIEQQKLELKENIIPLIEEKRKLTEDKQEATVYESFEGIKSALNYVIDTLNNDDEYYVFALSKELGEKPILKLFQDYHKKRIEKNIKVKLIAHTKIKKIVEDYYRLKLMDIRFTNRSLPVGLFIFKNHVTTIVLGERPTAFVIKSKRNYEAYKEFFEEIWEKAKK